MISCGVRIFAGVCAVALISVLGAQDESKPQPSPKDLFLHPRQLPYHTIDVPADQGQAKPGQTDKKGVGKKSGGKKENRHKLGETVEEGGAQESTKPETKVGDSVGLKYSVLKAVDGSMATAPPDAEFHNGDKIQIRFQSNYPGYLYILNKGTSGKCEKMFPSPEVESRDNSISAWREYILPPDGNLMGFHDAPGVEKLTILFARQPEPDFEKLVCSPSSDGKSADDELARRKQMYSRDLRIEKAPDGIYAVNPSARVFLEIPLVHK